MLLLVFVGSHVICMRSNLSLSFSLVFSSSGRFSCDGGGEFQVFFFSSYSVKTKACVVRMHGGVCLGEGNIKWLKWSARPQISREQK